MMAARIHSGAGSAVAPVARALRNIFAKELDDTTTRNLRTIGSPEPALICCCRIERLACSTGRAATEIRVPPDSTVLCLQKIEGIWLKFYGAQTTVAYLQSISDGSPHTDGDANDVGQSCR